MRAQKPQLGIFILVLAVITVGGLMHSSAFAQAKSDVVSSMQTRPSVAAATTTYWTEERMRNAIAMPMFALGSGQTPAMSATSEEGGPEGPMVSAPSGGPGDLPEAQTLPQETQAGVQPTFGTAPFVYTRYRLFPNTTDNLLYRTFPYAITGKLFFTIPGRGDFVCSGAVVNAQNQSVVWTAGHCVFTPGRSPDQAVGFHTNFVFVPGRIAGTNPFGTWTVLQAFTLVGWTTFVGTDANGNPIGLLEYDHGALVMNRGGTSNQRIADAVGFLGFRANVPREQHWHLHGYPAGPRALNSTPPGPQFDGEHHEICAAARATDDQPTGIPGVDPPTIGVGCDQTGGTSGGPWVIDFSGVPGQTNFLNGNNSYKNTALDLYTPYFTTGAINLRNTAQAVAVP